MHLQPHFGAKRVDAITTEQVQRLKHALTNRAPKTVNNVLTVLKVVLRKAVEWNVLERIAYAWSIVAALLAVWAAGSASPVGIWGASRHSLTVGFLAAMVFCIGPRILPAFSGGRVLFSPRLMFWALLLLNVGCTVRVASEVLAYRQLVAGAWQLLPASAIVELTAETMFATNLAVTLAARPVSPSSSS